MKAIYMMNGAMILNHNMKKLHTCKSYEDVSKNIILEESAKLTELYVTINNNGKTFDCGCAQNCSQLYNVYVKECDNNFDNDYCRELENFKLKYEEKMKSINAFYSNWITNNSQKTKNK
ncbi:hypothetical protein PVIIG_05542 [Plasmodium vivax India VII]|uniref:Uncharacterized protein n=1 Tax=Plasmodium vivax India VII TaxID=1077284 RepID=A0A0J9SFH8_PLAVI|nr:hypothetical protein PVIIG_05542 [Plasmodium vivax India VII]